MAPALSQPLLLFCQAILLGMAAALLYDLLRAFRLRLPRLTSALDILYCMAAGLAVFLFMLRRAQGQLRLYLLLGAVGGGCLLYTSCGARPPPRPPWTAGPSPGASARPSWPGPAGRYPPARPQRHGDEMCIRDRSIR